MINGMGTPACTFKQLWDNVRVTRQVSSVMFFLFLFILFFFYKIVELVGGGSVINGAYPV